MESVKIKVLETTDCIAKEGKAYVGYVRVATNFSNQLLKTRTSEKSKSPTFDQEFTFLLADQLEKAVHPALLFTMMKKARWPHQDSVIGEASVSITDGKDFDGWISFESTKKKPNGKIHIVLTYNKAASATTPTEKKKVFESLYSQSTELGRGAFSVVYKGVRLADKKEIAIKRVKKAGQSSDVIRLLKREISVMQKLQHPGIVALYDVFETDDEITMVLELVNGGELYDQIIARGSFTEKDAIEVIVQLLYALDYMHQNGVSHRDLKPENLLCENGVKTVKIADFGLSKDFSMASLMQTCCGSPSYVAPEVLTGGTYDTACDVWSLGVISFVLLSGYLPFFADTQPDLFDKIMEGSFSFSQPLWNNVSHEAKDFITQCLTLEPSSRPSAAALLKHAWIVKKEKASTSNLETIASMADLRSGFNPKTRGRG